MEILFVSMTPLMSNTSANLSNIGCLKGLLELGHIIDMVTLEPDACGVGYDASNQFILNIRNTYYLPQNPIYKRMRTKKDVSSVNIEVESKKRIVKNFGRWIRSLINMLMVFDPQIINVCKMKVGTHYDLVISTSDPKSSHILAEHVIKENHLKCPWYQYWGDPMYDDITNECGIIKKTRLKHAEQNLLSMADRIIYVSPLTCRKQKLLYPKEAVKMVHAVQACIKEDEASVSFMLKDEAKVTLGYFGDYNSKIRNIVPLVEAIKSFTMGKLIVAGCGDIPIRDQNIEINPRLPYERIEQLEKEVDILVGICNIKGTQIPAKFYYMAGTQKPIIIIIDGENREYLFKHFERYKRYIICENQPNEIIKAINDAVDQIRSKKIYTVPEELKPINVAEKILGKH